MNAAKSRQSSLVEETQRVWQSRLGRDLSREEARQLTSNIIGFFRTLSDWSATERQSAQIASDMRPRRGRHD
jgi:hypothetical protein